VIIRTPIEYATLTLYEATSDSLTQWVFEDSENSTPATADSKDPFEFLHGILVDIGKDGWQLAGVGGMTACGDGPTRYIFQRAGESPQQAEPEPVFMDGGEEDEEGTVEAPNAPRSILQEAASTLSAIVDSGAPTEPVGTLFDGDEEVETRSGKDYSFPE
jgi:hypothetical protein